MISESAVVTAQIRAASVSVAGKVSGDIIATQRIEIRANAKMSGNLTAPILVVQEGALFEGHCSMQPEGVREDRKITVFPKEERVAQVAGVRSKANLLAPRAARCSNRAVERIRVPSFYNDGEYFENPAGETP